VVALLVLLEKVTSFGRLIARFAGVALTAVRVVAGNVLTASDAL
jgi:predicted metal-binding membrane protein